MDAISLGNWHGSSISRDGSPKIMASSSIDSLVENDGRVDTLPLFNRIAPNALFARIPSGPQPYHRETRHRR